MNIVEKIIELILSAREKKLSLKLSKYKQTSHNASTKTVMSSDVTMTLNSETKKNLELVRKNAEEILQKNNYDPQKLLCYIKERGTKIHRVDKADKILAVINEEEGLITELRGLEALYMSFVVKLGFSLKTKPMFVMQEGEINPVFMIQQFYKWYSLTSNLPGFDYRSQKLFKLQMHAGKSCKMSLDDILGLKEAVARDKEASVFAYEYAKATEGSAKAFQKLNDGGANI